MTLTENSLAPCFEDAERDAAAAAPAARRRPRPLPSQVDLKGALAAPADAESDPFRLPFVVRSRWLHILELVLGS